MVFVCQLNMFVFVFVSVCGRRGSSHRLRIRRRVQGDGDNDNVGQTDIITARRRQHTEQLQHVTQEYRANLRYSFLSYRCSRLAVARGLVACTSIHSAHCPCNFPTLPLRPHCHSTPTDYSAFAPPKHHHRHCITAPPFSSSTTINFFFPMGQFVDLLTCVSRSRSSFFFLVLSLFFQFRD